MLASQKYNIGNPIHVGYPLVYILADTHRGKHCNNCLNKISGTDHIICFLCKTSYYCNEKCQQVALRHHKAECYNLMEMAPKILSSECRMFFILCMNYQKYGNSCSESFQGIDRCLKNLKSHTKEIALDKVRLQTFADLMKDMKQFSRHPFFDQVDLCYELYGKMMMNTFSIYNNEQVEPIGIGLYLGLSSVNHNCQPNCTIIFEGTMATLKAIKQIELGDKLTINYMGLGPQPSKIVQHQLQKRYYFICKCELCCIHNKDPMQRSFKCFKCSKTVELAEGQRLAKCTECGYIHGYTEIDEINTITADIIGRVKIARKISFRRIRNGENAEDDRYEFVTLYNKNKLIEQRIPDENCFMMAFLMAQYNLHVRQEDYDICRQLIDRLMKYYRHYYCNYDTKYNILVFLQLKLAIYNRQKATRKSYADVMHLMHLMHGKNSKLCLAFFDHESFKDIF